MTKRIFKSIILASVIVLLASGGLTIGVLYNHFGNQLEEELYFLIIVQMQQIWKTIWTEKKSRKLWKREAEWQ